MSDGCEIILKPWTNYVRHNCTVAMLDRIYCPIPLKGLQGGYFYIHKDVIHILTQCFLNVINA